MFYLLKYVSGSYVIRLPIFGVISPMIAVVFVPVLLIPVAVIHQRLRAWRKAHGRDIELEEKHEFEDSDLISLRERQPHEHSSKYRGLWGKDD